MVRTHRWLSFAIRRMSHHRHAEEGGQQILFNQGPGAQDQFYTEYWTGGHSVGICVMLAPDLSTCCTYGARWAFWQKGC